MSKTFVCPYWLNFSPKKFNLLFTKASLTRKSDKKMFAYTHTPVKVIDANENEISEKEILKLFDTNDPRKVVVVIQGNTGTGKSELCVYLSLELEKMDRLVFHVEKNASLMDILTRDIPDFFEKHTGLTFPIKDELSQLNKHLRTNPKIIAQYAASSLVLRLIQEEVLSSPEQNDVLVEKLTELVGKHIKKLVVKGESPVDMYFVTAQDLKGAFRIVMDILPWSDVETATIELNNILWEEIRKKYQVPTLDDAIYQIIKAMDKRPVIIFEDFSIAGLDLEKLSLFMENDNPDSLCDFVVAGLQEKVPSRSGTRVDRFAYYETTSSGHQEVLFLNEDSCVDFIEPFLKYPKIEKYLDENGVSESLEYELCKKCNRCEDVQIYFTPLNATFIRRLYSHLEIAERTPRLFVDKIRQILEDYKLRSIIPSDSRWVSQIPVTHVVDNKVVEDVAIKNLFEWFGFYNGEALVLDAGASTLFELDLSEYEDNGLIQTPIFEGILDDYSETISSTISDEDLSEISKIKGQYGVWKRDPSSKKTQEFYLFFNIGLRELINEYSAGYKLTPRSNIALRLGRNEYPFIIGENINSIEQAVEISTSLFSQTGAILIAQAGYLFNKSRKNKKYLEESFKQNVFPLSKMVYDLRKNMYDNIISSEWTKSSSSSNLYEVIMSCIYMLMVIDNSFIDTNHNDVISWLNNKSDKKFLLTHIEKLNENAKNGLTSIINNKDGIINVANDLFGLTSKNYDVLKMKKYSKHTPTNVLRHIKMYGSYKNVLVFDKIIADVIKPYRKITSYSDDLKEYLNEFYDDYLDDGILVNYLIDYIYDIKIEDIVKLIKEFMMYDIYDEELLSNLKYLMNYGQKDFNDLYNKLKKLRYMMNNMNTQWIRFKYLLAKKNLYENKLMSLLIEINNSLIKLSSNIKKLSIDELTMILKGI